jgi:hypothetical protein
MDVALPVEIRRARIAFAQYVVPFDRAFHLVAPTGLEPAEVVPGRALCALSLVDYIDGDLGAYKELALAVVVRRYGAPARSALQRVGALYRGDIGIYMHRVPVTETVPCVAGVEVWGLPKFVGDMSITRERGAVTGTLHHRGEHVATLRVRAGGGLRVPAAAFDTYTHRDGVLRSFSSRLGGAGAGFRPGGARLEVGTRHPMALELRALGLPKRALFSGTIDRAFGTFDGPVVVRSAKPGRTDRRSVWSCCEAEGRARRESAGDRGKGCAAEGGAIRKPHG